MQLKPLFRNPLSKLASAILGLSFLGFIDAAFLAIKFFQGEIAPCSVLKGCEVVTTSQYSTIGNVPIALLGALYYLVLILLSVYYLDSKNRLSIKIASLLTFSGFAISAVLVYLQLFVLQAICLYCMASALVSTLLFVIGLYILKQMRFFAEVNSHVKGLSKPEWVWSITRVSLGFVFLWTFLSKMEVWFSGGSPATGFLTKGTSGPFAEMFASLAGSPIVDALYMVGMGLIGLSLILGIGMKIATYSGALMMLLIYLADFPPAHNPIIDDHIIYILLLKLMLLNNAGNYLGFGKFWSSLPVTKKYPVLI